MQHRYYLTKFKQLVLAANERLQIEGQLTSLAKLGKLNGSDSLLVLVKGESMTGAWVNSKFEDTRFGLREVLTCTYSANSLFDLVKERKELFDAVQTRLLEQEKQTERNRELLEVFEANEEIKLLTG